MTRQFSQNAKQDVTFIVSGGKYPFGYLVFVANHQSDFDIPLIAAYAGKPLGFVAKKEMKKVPIVRDWMEMIKCSFIDRDSARKSMEAILKAIETVKSGHSMVIYPEGTRNKGYLELEFKAGSFKLATKSHASLSRRGGILLCLRQIIENQTGHGLLSLRHKRPACPKLPRTNCRSVSKGSSGLRLPDFEACNRAVLSLAAKLKPGQASGKSAKAI